MISQNTCEISTNINFKVKVWFQNRRIKSRKQRKASTDDSIKSGSSSYLPNESNRSRSDSGDSEKTIELE